MEDKYSAQKRKKKKHQQNSTLNRAPGDCDCFFFYYSMSHLQKYVQSQKQNQIELK